MVIYLLAYEKKSGFGFWTQLVESEVVIVWLRRKGTEGTVRLGAAFAGQKNVLSRSSSFLRRRPERQHGGATAEAKKLCGSQGNLKIS
ncbi:hypothetical protein VTL71DRAFT_5018 [Oculimacula yallundae]|uniref:Uncharacterized protein n=1 Tax=Oculimacula yallundae TaxID=86028 RepID=A0ABR4C1J7_9HELO